MVTGSLASSFHGAPRATRDVDVVVDAEEDVLQRLGSQLRDSGLYVDPKAISEATRTRGQFNAIDPTSGLKIDFILRKDRPFSVTEFGDRTSGDFMGRSLSLVRPEDLVVAKLEWAKLGESERQLRDVVGILMIQGDDLDRARVMSWVGQLGLEQQWELVLEMERSESEST